MQGRGARDTGLLDTLGDRMGCMYLSDLRWLSGKDRIRLADAVADIPVETAKTEDWDEAVRYLTGTLSDSQTPLEGKQTLIRRLSAD